MNSKFFFGGGNNKYLKALGLLHLLQLALMSGVRHINARLTEAPTS